MPNAKSIPTSLVWSIVAVFYACLTSPIAAQDDGLQRDTLLTAAQWDAFNKNLVSTIHSDHQGAKFGAIKQVAMYGKHLEWPELTVIEVVRTAREADDTASRRMAVVAAANMSSNWAIEYFDMLSQYESDPAVKSTMEAVVKQARR